MLSPDEAEKCKQANQLYAAFLRSHRQQVLENSFQSARRMRQERLRKAEERPFWVAAADDEASQDEDLFRKEPGTRKNENAVEYESFSKDVKRTYSRFSVAYVLDSLLLSVSFLRERYHQFCRYIETCFYVAINVLRSRGVALHLRNMRLLLDAVMNMLESVFGSAFR
eukprot:ANDGO_02331.mRNA.1 hypothetical protein